MPVSCVSRSLVHPAVIAGAAFACLLVAGNASASIQGRHVAPRIGHATSQTHCLPAPPHADPFASDSPLVAVLAGGKTSSDGWLSELQALPGIGERPTPAEDPGGPDRDLRTVSTLPSHWGATHLSV